MKKVITLSTFKNSTSKLLSTFICALIIGCVNTASFSQQYLPRHYWTFEGSNPMKDSMNNSALNPTFYNGSYAITNGDVGSSLSLDAGSRAIVSTSNLQIDSAVTIEFLFKPSHEFALTNFLNRRDNAIIVRMGYAYLQFTTNIISSTGTTVNDNFTVDLEAIGRGSYSYYVDGNYHHFVLKYNAKSGVKEIWIDGQLPVGFSKTTATGLFNANTSNANNNIIDLNTNTSYYKINGYMDEIALYNISLPSNSIYKHYQNFQAGQHYSFAISTVAPPIPSPITGPVDLNEYAVGHPNYTVSAVDQLKDFPTPRYKKGNSMIPNFNWMGLRYVAGEFQPGVSSSQAVANSIEIQKELAKNFNYSILVSGNTSSYNQYNDVTKFNGAWVQLANQNPQWPTAAISFWAQMNPQNAGFTSNMGYIENKSLPNNHYLKNSSGQFVGLSGSISTNKFWSPAAPIDSFIKDGLTQKFYMQSLLNSMTRPLNFISENAEVIPKPSSTAMQADPSIAADKATTQYDWDSYLGNRKMRVATTYRNQFLNAIPALANTNYSEYQISGSASRHKYSETRTINKPINGQIYATPDFYPRWPNNWQTGVSAWNGWKHIIEGRYYELQQNDKLYSPFIAAGWNEDEERNIRPAQWLGLLKALSMTGAEFFYTGFFNEASSYTPPNPAPANPAGYIWQAVVPSYAQATASRYEDILRNGSLLDGDIPYSVSSTNPGYSFNTGDSRKLVVVRKHNSLNKYAITGSLQPNSNMQGNAELEGDAKIDLNGQEIQFKVRRQGSTYTYDNTNPSQPVFIQLDSWHEASHPSRWSKDFNIEAELFDNAPAAVTTKTQRPSGAVNGDFREFTTYVGFTNSSTSSTLEYNFTVKNSPNYYLWVRARSNNGASTGLSAVVGSTQKSIGCISDTAWQWYSLDACSGQAIAFLSLTNNQEYKLQILSNNSSLEIDKILLSVDPALNLNPSQGACGASVAAVTTSGPTNFCQGGSVTLTAATGSSYAWSNGQTTQSIIVNQAGNYSVSVGTGSGCNSVSNPIAVTVLNKPFAAITSSGVTTICNGQNVTLSSSTASSYTWSNGLTTQNINVSTAGNYSVTVTGSNGCTATSAIQTVSVGVIPSATISNNNGTSICQGNSTTLSAPAGLTYAWSNGSTTQTINVNSTGAYSVVVTGSNGCTNTSSPINVLVNSLPSVNVTANNPTTFCTGGSVTLTASGSGSYLWSNGSTSSSITTSNSGNYVVTVTNANGCSASSSSTNVVSNPLPSANITVSGSTAISAGQTTTLVATGGVSYIWNPGNSTTSSLVVSSPGIYNVTAIDANGCSSSSNPITITQTTNPINVSIISSGNSSFCEGSNLVLTAAGGSNYLWSPGGQSSNSISVTQSGTYYLFARNSQGQIIGRDSITVTVNPKPMAPWISITYIPNTAFQLNAYEPSAVSYLWSNAQTNSSITVNTPQTLTVRATNAFGCISSDGTIEVGNVTMRSCVKPDMLTAYNLSDTTAMLGWNPAVTAELINVRIWERGSSVITTKQINGNISTLRMNNLNPATNYEWSVQTLCASGNNTSNSGSFRTLGNPLSCGSTPQHTRTENINTKKATLRWYNTVGDSYKVRFKPSGSSTYSYRILTGSQYATGTQINNLLSNTTYEWQVQAICSGYTTPYTQPTYFTTIDTCGFVGTLTASSTTPSTATLSWENKSTMDTVRIRLTNLNTGTIRLIFLQGNPVNGKYELKGLKSNTTYKAEVKGKCSTGASGAWSNSVTFATQVLSTRLEDAGVLQLLAYPSPTSDVLNYTFTSDKASDYVVKVCDLSGRELLNEQRVAETGENNGELDVTNFAKGFYLLVVQCGTDLSRFRFTVQ